MKRHTSNSGDSGKRYRWFLTCFLASVALLFALALPRIVNATVFNVPAGDVTALINAINDANNEGANPGPDTINLAASTYTLTAADNAPNGLPFITSTITINGNGATIERSSAIGTANFRIFIVDSTGNLTLNDLTIENGFTVTSGGGILNVGTVTITNSTLSGNSAEGDGGGISTFGTGAIVTITNSTLSGNHASVGGGAILNNNTATLTITNSTLSGNSAGAGGGGILNGGTVTIQNSIFNNLSGGNCFNAGSSFTFTANSSDLATDNTCPGFAPAVTSTALNLGPLKDNGGPTETHALLPGSPAIDAADDSVCPVKDQRGFERDLLCDIAARGESRE